IRGLVTPQEAARNSKLETRNSKLLPSSDGSLYLPHLEAHRGLAAEDGDQDAQLALLGVDLGDHALHAGEGAFLDLDPVLEVEGDLEDGGALLLVVAGGGDLDDALGLVGHERIRGAGIGAEEAGDAVDVADGLEQGLGRVHLDVDVAREELLLGG